MIHIVILLFAACVTLSVAHAPELTVKSVINPESDLSQVGFVWFRQLI